MNYLFKSVIPSNIPASKPIGGSGDPNATGRYGVPGQIYTQSRGNGLPDITWCKGGLDPQTGWFVVGSATGHPITIPGNYLDTDPTGLYTISGPAVWYGYDKSVWVKTSPVSDGNNWNFLTFDPTIGFPDFFTFNGPPVTV